MFSETKQVMPLITGITVLKSQWLHKAFMHVVVSVGENKTQYHDFTLISCVHILLCTP
jgi:hypothetical protein